MLKEGWGGSPGVYLIWKNRKKKKWRKLVKCPKLRIKPIIGVEVPNQKLFETAADKKQRKKKKKKKKKRRKKKKKKEAVPRPEAFDKIVCKNFQVCLSFTIRKKIRF